MMNPPLRKLLFSKLESPLDSPHPTIQLHFQNPSSTIKKLPGVKCIPSTRRNYPDRWNSLLELLGLLTSLARLCYN